MTPDQKLALFLQADPVRDRDPLFVAEVMQKAARRSALMAWLATAPWAIAGAALLWASNPIVARAFGDIGGALSSPLQTLGMVLSLLLAAGLSGLSTPLLGLTKNSRGTSHL